MLILQYLTLWGTIMRTTALSSKGQIIIPKPIRDHHRWPPGTQFVVEEVPEGIILKPKKPFPPTTLEEGLGCTGYRGPARTVTEMKESIDADVRKKWRRSRKS